MNAVAGIVRHRLQQDQVDMVDFPETHSPLGEEKTGWSPSKNAKIWGHLWQEVVHAGHCMMCGACVAACPVNVLYVGAKEEPVIVGPCAACQVCYRSCPRLELPIDEIEHLIHGRTRMAEEETLGICKATYSARAVDEKFRHSGQDGGTSTALLAHALEIGLVNSFVTTGLANSNSAFVLASGTPMKAVPIIGSTKKDLIGTAGSKYIHGGLLGGLSDAAASFPNGRIGIVALPCELQGLWRMRTSLRGTHKFGGSGIAGGRPVLTIGLFCSKVFYHERLAGDFIQKKHGVDPSKITKTVIKHGRFRAYTGPEIVVDAPVKELDEYVSTSCRYCIDYTSEFADISVGGIGSPDGWNTVIVRTEVGESLFESARKANAVEARPFGTSRSSLELLIKLVAKKKLENNAYYLRRGMRSEHLLRTLPRPSLAPNVASRDILRQ
ncbi:Coenzyme F420 hydrogenase/dehydrogenase, beta subunit C-terminal domain [[Eubacterium] cellulosolvens]